MLRVVRSELRHRRARSLALLAGILLATTSFTVLTGTSETQRLEVRGTVAERFRGTYDVLVRPRASRSAAERRTGEVQPNHLSGLFGGISLAEWRAIRRLPGIEVAAPIANVGYVLSTARLPVDVSSAAGSSGRVLLRARIRWRTDRGLTHVPDAAQYAYVTPNRLSAPPIDPDLSFFERESLRETVPGRGSVPVCFSGFNAADMVLDGPFSWRFRSQLGCFSRRNGSGRFGARPFARAEPQIEVRWSFPFLLAAIDPEQEARLTGLGRAVVEGRFLTGRDGTRLAAPEPRPGEPGETWRRRLLPVLAASRPFVDEQAEVEVERLSGVAAAGLLARRGEHGDSQLALDYLRRQPPGPVVQRAKIPASRGYAQLLDELRDPSVDQLLSAFWSVGPTAADRRGDALVPKPVASDTNVWQSSSSASSLDFAYAPATARDVGFRAVTVHVAQTDPSTPESASTPFISTLGVFDPDRLRGTELASGAPLTTYQPPELTARDRATEARLGGRSLGPNGNLGGYIAQPPLLLTTLRAATAFTSGLYPAIGHRRPISAIRVRVAGVTGPDAVSRERIRQAAERIATRTGLIVDITAGASGAPRALDLPAGRFGRPPLALREAWVRKGVAAEVLTAVDRKSVLLFGLILVVCGLFVTNAVSAALRARRSELGVLAALGWSPGRLLAVLLVEVGAIGLAAGFAGGVLALPLAAVVGVEASVARAALAVPAATGLALLAAVVPVWRATRSPPAATLAPAVLGARRAWRPRGLWQLALVNLLRTPGRTATAACSLGIGVCALTFLLAARVAFDDALVGTVLGEAVAVQVRSTDYVAVVATIVLGAAGVADVLFLNVRERAAELATLHATGWDDGRLARLVGLEGLLIGILGALLGGAAGVAGAAAFAGAVPASLILTAVVAALAGVVVTVVAATAPALWLRRLPTVPLLAAE